MKKFIFGLIMMSSVSAIAAEKMITITKVASQTATPWFSGGNEATWGDGYGHTRDQAEMKPLIESIATKRAADACSNLGGQPTNLVCDTQLSGEKDGFTCATACSVSCAIK